MAAESQHTTWGPRQCQRRVAVGGSALATLSSQDGRGDGWRTGPAGSSTSSGTRNETGFSRTAVFFLFHTIRVPVCQNKGNRGKKMTKKERRKKKPQPRERPEHSTKTKQHTRTRTSGQEQTPQSPRSPRVAVARTHRSVFWVWSVADMAGETVAIMTTRARLDVNESLSTRVSLEARKGTCELLLSSALQKQE